MRDDPESGRRAGKHSSANGACAGGLPRATRGPCGAGPGGYTDTYMLLLFTISDMLCTSSLAPGAQPGLYI
eukprot:6195922-Pleurochrysis_carterae.AAC.3